MKAILIGQLIFVIVTPLQSETIDEARKRCLSYTDYSGCLRSLAGKTFRIPVIPFSNRLDYRNKVLSPEDMD